MNYFLVNIKDSTKIDNLVEKFNELGSSYTKKYFNQNPIVLIKTNFDRDELSKILYIAKGQISESQRSTRGLQEIEIRKYQWLDSLELFF